MSELSCDTPFIGRNDTDDLSLYQSPAESVVKIIMHTGTPAVVSRFIKRRSDVRQWTA